MSPLPRPHAEDLVPPVALNVAILVFSSALAAGLLHAASHAAHWTLTLLCAFAFSYVGNTLFALLHESVHRVFARAPAINETGGILAAAFFPTGLTFQRICHLGHHLRNRTDHEMFDTISPDDNRFLKYAQFYSILTGIYWLSIPVGWLLYLVLPWSYRLFALEGKALQRTGAIMMRPFLNHPRAWRIRAELLFTIAFQVTLFLALDLTWWGWLACYWLFGLNWGSLQYADHAWSARDIRSGAWNLRVNPLTRLLFLNYHHHRAHHEHPYLPWIRLGKYVDTSLPRPHFWKVYTAMWKGPRPADAPPPAAIDDELLTALEDADLNGSGRMLAGLDPGAVRSRVAGHASEGSEGAPPRGLSTWAIEWLCVKQNLHFSRRHPRYFRIFLALMLYSLPRFRATRILRVGYACLQLVDDILDGDRPWPGEPLEAIAALRRGVDTDVFPGNEPGLLACRFVRELDEVSPDGEGREVFAHVLETMMRDRARVLEGRLLTETELEEQHVRTFAGSLDIVLISLGSRLRVRECPEIAPALGWASTLRDLDEDLRKGLVNVPAEVLQAAGLARTAALASLTEAALLSNAGSRAWFAQRNNEIRSLLERSAAQVLAMKGERGSALFRLFHKACRKKVERFERALAQGIA